MLWLVMVSMAPATWLGRELVKAVLFRYEQACFVTVKLQSTGSRWNRCLMEAFVHELRRQKAVSSVSEAIIEHWDEDEEGSAKWLATLLPI